MPRTTKDPYVLFGLVVVWLAVVAIDLWLRPLSLAQNSAYVRMVCLPSFAVFGWPVGIWLWHKTRLESSAVERLPLYALASISWLLAGLMALGYIWSWFFMPRP